MEAFDVGVPLYERIKFLAIYSSNLDEFFRVRVALIKRLIQLSKEKLNTKLKIASPDELLQQIISEVNRQQDLFGQILRESILPALMHHKIHLYYAEEYAAEHSQAVEDLFYTEILSFIQPIIAPKNNPEPIFLDDKKLYMIADLEREGVEYVGIVNIPSEEVPRFQQLPNLAGNYHFTFIDDVIKRFAQVIFAGFKVKSCTNVKLNRDAELFLDKEYTDSVAEKIRKSLNNRKIGAPSRFLYEPGISKSVLETLKQGLQFQDEDCIEGGEYHNMDDLFALPNPVGAELENEPLPPLANDFFRNETSIFEAIEKRDILLSFPYHRYDYVLRFFNEAAIDPEVRSIKATLYRVARQSHITNALISAARNGKDVTVLVEAKARFDEENNLMWSERMEEAGVNVVYSPQSIKVHSKVALVTKEHPSGTKKYCFLGTGNFNEQTASVYTDYALLTANPQLTSELDDVLEFTFGRNEEVELQHLVVAQLNMPETFSALIEKEIEAALAGKKAHIILKLNNLQDRKVIKNLFRAAEAGVQIDIIVRGICCMAPRNNIRLTRIVDRFLEHSRAYLFHNRGDERIFLGSADWMERNLYERIEVVFPVYASEIKEVIKHNLELQLRDNTKAVLIDDQLQNIRVNSNTEKVRAQHDYYHYLKAGAYSG